MKIGIFDSGIGGLTVLKSLVDKYPSHQYFYFGDTIHLPYGEKSKEELMEYSDKIIKFLLEKEVDLIIIACGTVSSNLYDIIKKKYNVEIIDIISPTIDYINNGNYQKLGIIGTRMTIKSKTFENQIKAPVISNACPMFVPYIENRQVETKEFNRYFVEYMDVFKNENIDGLILGCTHYPLVSDKIKEYLGDALELIDLGKVIANKLDFQKEGKGRIELYFSKIDNNLINNVQNIINEYKIIEKRL